MARKILITSGKGGVGKTSVTAHLGYSLSKLGQRVVVIDMDEGLNNLDVVTDVDNKVLYDLKDVLDGKCRVKQTLIEVTPTFSVIASRHTFEKELTGKNVKDLTDGLSARFDYILIDSPAGIDFGFRRAVSAAEEVLLVVTPTLTSVRDAAKVLSILNNYSVKVTGAVINKMRGDLLLRGDVLCAEEISSVLKTAVIGCIPDDDAVYLASGRLDSSSRADKAFRMLAKRILKGKGSVYDATKYYRGIKGALRRNLRQNV